MPAIVISGYYGAGNLGDEAILAAMLQALRRAVPAAECVVISRDPARTAALHGVPAVGRGALRDLLRILRRADLLLSGGGGLLQDSYPRRLLPASVLYYLSVCVLGRLAGCRVMFYAQGIGPLRRSISRRLVRAVAERAALITVRDPDSATLLRELGVRRTPLEVTADPVLAWEPEADPGIPKRLGLDDGSGVPLLMVALRPWPGGMALRIAAEAADRAVVEWGARVAFLPFARADVEAAQEARALMRRPEEAVILPTLAPEEAYGAIARAAVVLGMRLHALIFAALAGVPPVGLAYDPKVTAFLARLGLAEMALPLDAGGGEVWRALAAAREARGSIEARLAESVARLREAALLNAVRVRELLAGPAAGAGRRAAKA